MEQTQSALTLYTLLATRPHTAALKKADVHSPLVNFDFEDVKVVNRRFKALVREAKFDLAEVAIVTALQAKAYGKPYTLLPVVVIARGQHHTILYNAGRGHLTPADLSGRRVGVRAYTQTTGAWVRGILEEDYGVDFRRVRWVTFEDPHLAEYRDPSWVKRAPADKELLQMLLDGQVDAAIFGSEMPDSKYLKALIPDVEAAARNWADRHGGVPINHMLVIKDAIVKSRPDVVREVFRLFRESAEAAPIGTDLSALRFGVEPNRRSLETILDYSARQELIPRRYQVDELFDDVTRSLR